MVIFFLVAITIINPNEILYFPIKIYNAIQYLYLNQKVPSALLFKESIINALQPLSFYVILFLSLKKYLNHEP
jgi:hypothetical protein